jgi:hypothetical protein
MQIDKDVRAREGKQDHHRPQVYAARNKTVDRLLQVAPLQMSYVWSHLLTRAKILVS